jgi:hypothetical protein
MVRPTCGGEGEKYYQLITSCYLYLLNLQIYLLKLQTYLRSCYKYNFIALRLKPAEGGRERDSSGTTLHMRRTAVRLMCEVMQRIARRCAAAARPNFAKKDSKKREHLYL